MDKVEKFLLGVFILLIVFAGFSIRINSFHWEYKGLIRIVFKLIYGRDLEI